MSLGTEIKRLRIAHGYTQQELGEKLGVKKAAVQKYEKGTVKNLKQDTIMKLCQIFNVNPAVFMDAVYDTDQLSKEVKLLEELSIFYGNRVVDLLEMYQSLNNQGKEKLFGYACDLTQITEYKDI